MNGARMYQAIKLASEQADEAKRPVDVCTGELKTFDLKRKERKIEVKISQKLCVCEKALVFASSVFDKMAAGDQLILIKSRGGQLYYVIDTIRRIGDDSAEQ